MATFLYRLGRFSFRRRALVAALWGAVPMAALAGAATLSGATSDAFRIPGTPSQQAIDLLQERFPQASADGATARVVFAVPGGQRLTDAAHRAAVETAVAELKDAPQVASVSDPFAVGAVSQDATVGFAQAAYRVQAAELSDRARAALTAVVDNARAHGLTVEVGGDVLPIKPEQGAGEAIAVVVAAVVLVITFGSLVAAGLPLLSALLGIGISVAAITAASGFVGLSSTTPVLALMLGLAVAIDYSLFIVSRYRHELAAGRDREEAAGRAVGTAGSARCVRRPHRGDRPRGPVRRRRAVPHPDGSGCRRNGRGRRGHRADLAPRAARLRWPARPSRSASPCCSTTSWSG
jgi:RND superfamily putative drug exporter